MNYKWLDQKAILENSLHIRVFEEIKSKALDSFFEESKSMLGQMLQYKKLKLQQQQKEDQIKQ